MIDTLLGRGIRSGTYEVRYNCPFCAKNGKGQDNKGHLYVNEAKGVLICFRCGERGPLEVLYRFFGVEKGEPVPVKAEDLLSQVEMLVGETLRVKNPEVKYPCEVTPIVSGMWGWTYLRGARNIPQWAIREHRMVQGEMRNEKGESLGERVFIPTFDSSGKMQYWVARALDSKAPQKYLNPVGVAKTCVFNLNNVPPGSPLIICEGVFSAITAHQWAVALFGKVATPSQLYDLLQFETSMYFVALDGDAQNKEAVELASSLSLSGRPVRIIRLPDGEDPDSIGAGNLWKLPIDDYDTQFQLNKSIDTLTGEAVPYALSSN